MYIPGDIVDLIIDQLVFGRTGGAESPGSLAGDLRAASLVSTRWVDHSQHYLFSTIEFYQEVQVHQWCSRITSDPCGVPRHVRTLKFGPRMLRHNILETALRRLPRFPNLQKLVLHGRPRVSPSVPFSTTRERFQWDQEGFPSDDWKALCTLTDLLPNLVEIDLSLACSDRCLIQPPTLPLIDLSSGHQPSDLLASRHLTSQGLWITVPSYLSPRFLEYSRAYLRVLDFRGLMLSRDGSIEVLFEACHVLQEVYFPLVQCFVDALRLCPSNSISLIRIINPPRLCECDTPEDFCKSNFVKCVHGRVCNNLYVSIREVAQKFSAHNYGSKTRVQVVYAPGEPGGDATFDKETPLFMRELKKELGEHITLETDFLPP